MTWTAPRTWTTGELMTAAMLNAHLRDNLLETAAAKATAAGQIPYATGANALAMTAAGSAGQRLQVNAAGTAAEWSSARRCRLYLAANQSIPDGVATEVLWDGENSDPDGWHGLVTNPGRITPTLPGLYLVTAHVAFVPNTTGTRDAAVRKNGVSNTLSVADLDAPATASGLYTRIKIVRTFELNGTTDYVSVYASQNSGGALNVVGSATVGVCWFEVVHLGA